MKSKITTTRGRHYSGVVGLKAGYEESGKVFTRPQLISSYKQWLKNRHQAGQNFIGAVFGLVEDIGYGFEQDGRLEIYEEPVVCVRGEIASYQEHLSDAEVIEALQSLFEYLGTETRQTTVRFTYWGIDDYRESFRLRLPDTSHPLD